MTARNEVDACTSLDKLVKAKNNLSKLAESLEEKRFPATVIFFDLVGSTGYRRRHGPEKGLRKAYIHNTIASRAIQNASGCVVKWMGDGVMGCFMHSRCTNKHPVLALNAALEGLKLFSEYNERCEGIDEELHTKVSISTGNFHYLDVGDNTSSMEEESHCTLDPIGSEVDLAARMNSLCERDVILIDAETFWGTSSGESDASDESTPIPICTADRDLIRWRELILSDVRDTVYLPTTAGFFVNDDGLQLCRIGRGASDPVDGNEFLELVQHDAGSHTTAVFCCKPIQCNIKGFEQTVDVVAITTSPHPKPIVEQVYDWYPDEIRKIEERAEKSFREGNVDQALQQFHEVLEIDARQFHSNTRVAMIQRSQKNTEDALKHLMAAKLSNPICPLVWGIAGITHLDDYIRDRGDKNECLTRAVTGLSRARQLAERQFHGLMEQYTTALLAIVLSLRGTPEDISKAKMLVDKLELWPAKNSTVNIVKRLASSFLRLVTEPEKNSGNHDSIKSIIRDAESGELIPIEEASQKAPYDHLISTTDIHNLVAKAKFLIELE